MREEASGPECSHRAENRAGADEHEGFGDKLTNQAARRSAECAAHGKFAATAFGANQKQACDVDRSDGEQETGTGEKHDENGPNVTDDVLREWNDIGALPTICVGIFLFELCGD